jgi:hypothetical protein
MPGPTRHDRRQTKAPLTFKVPQGLGNVEFNPRTHCTRPFSIKLDPVHDTI